MPTSLSAQPMMAFSSPLLSSVDRLLSGFESRFFGAGLSSSLSRSQSFTDRFFNRRLSSLGLASPHEGAGFVSREQDSPTLTPAESWIPSNAELRGGTAGRFPTSAGASAARSLPAPPKPAVAISVQSAAKAAAPSLPMVPAQSARSQAPDESTRSHAPAELPRSQAPAVPVGGISAIAAPSLAPAPAVSPVAVVAPVAPLASSRPSPAARALAALPELAEAILADGTSAAEEPRGRDLVAATSSPAPVASAAAPSPRASALGRSFQHLGWSDDRLGLGSTDPLLSLLSRRVPTVTQLDLATAEAAPSAQAARVVQGAALSQLMVAPSAIPASQEAAAPRPRPRIQTTSTAAPQPVDVAKSVAAPQLVDVAQSVAVPQPVDVAQSVAALSAISSPGIGPLAPLQTAGDAPAVAAERPQIGASAPGAVISSPIAATRPSTEVVAERPVRSRREMVRAEMAGLLAPLSPKLSPSLWLGETASREQTGSLATERAAVEPPSVAKPWTAPGGLTSQVEQFAARLGLPAAASLPSAARPQVAAQWSKAPGLPAAVQRLLQVQAQPEHAEREPRGFTGELPFLPTAQPVRASEARQAVADRQQQSVDTVMPTAAAVSASAARSLVSAPALVAPTENPAQSRPNTVGSQAGNSSLASVVEGKIPATAAAAMVAAAMVAPELTALSSVGRQTVAAPSEPSHLTGAVASARLEERSGVGTVPLAALSRPWQQVGGVATLAELFAAGVGLSSGSAQRAADLAGLGFGSSVLPSWLAAPSHFAPTVSSSHEVSARVAPTLAYLPAEAAPVSERAAPRPAGKVAVAAAPSTPALPASKPSSTGVSSTGQSSTVPPAAPVATRSPSPAEEPASSLVVTPSALVSDAPRVSERSLAPRLPSRTMPALGTAGHIGQLGGVAASSEAFARDHGVARAEELARPTPMDGSRPMRLVSVVGGQVFLVPEDRHRARRVSTEEAPQQRGSERMPSAQLARSARELTRVELPLSTGWQRPGGMALRSELLANQLGQWLPGSSPDAPTQWGRAPGLSSSLAQILVHPTREDVQPRWAFGPQGLLFVSGPASPVEKAQLASRVPNAPMARTVQQTPSGLPANLSPAAGSFEPTWFASRTQPIPALGEKTLPVHGSVSTAVPGTGVIPSEPSFPVMPWLRLGGMGALAELFSAEIGLGSGASQSLAQSLGVSSGRSLAPEWLRSFVEQRSSPELEARFAAMLPSLWIPTEPGSTMGSAIPKSAVRSTPALAKSPSPPPPSGLPAPGVLPMLGQQLETDGPLETGGPLETTGQPVLTPSGAAQSLPRGTGALRAGGLGAMAELFARSRGLERVPDDGEITAHRTDAADGASGGRWLPVAGGMVFVPSDSAATPVSGRPDLTPRGGSKLAVVPSVLAAMDWSKLGGLGVRSELFSSLLGRISSPSGAGGPSPLTGWEDLSLLLTSLPKQADSSDSLETVLPRWAWSGAGGLMFLGGASTERPAAAASGRASASPSTVRAGAGTGAMLPSAASAPGSLAKMAEAVADRSQAGARQAEHIASPLLPLLAGATTWNEARNDVRDVQGAYAQKLLTGFPKANLASAQTQEPTALWPKATLQQVERIEKVLSQLPTEWQPSMKVVSAIRHSGVALTPLWQELPRALQQVKPYERVDEVHTADDGEAEFSSAVASRSPALSMVGSTPLSESPSPSMPHREPAPSASAKPQAVEQVMREAVSSLIQSGGQAGASARLLDAIRSHASSQTSRADDRVNLGDLTMIALSMGQQRIAASSPDHPKDRLEPNVSNALRMKNHKQVEDDKNSYRKAVSEHAEQVVKFMKDQLEKQKQRGQF